MVKAWTIRKVANGYIVARVDESFPNLNTVDNDVMVFESVRSLCNFLRYELDSPVFIPGILENAPR